MKQVSWAVAGGAAGYGAARLAAADRFRVLEAPAAPLMSFTPHVAAGALAGSLLLRPKGAAATAAVTGAALTAMVLPRAIRRRQPQAGGQVLRVLTANLLAGWASAEAVVGLVRRNYADVLFLQELTDKAAARLRQAGLSDLLPYQMSDVTGRRRPGSGIYARFPLGSGLRLTPVSAAQPTARLELPGRTARGAGLRPSASPERTAIAVAGHQVARGTRRFAAARRSAAGGRRGLQRNRRSCAVPQALAHGPRRRRRPARRRAHPYLGTRRQASAPHARSCPRRPPMRRAGGIGTPFAWQ